MAEVPTRQAGVRHSGALRKSVAKVFMQMCCNPNYVVGGERQIKSSPPYKKAALAAVRKRFGEIKPRGTWWQLDRWRHSPAVLPGGTQDGAEPPSPLCSGNGGQCGGSVPQFPHWRRCP